MVAVRLDAWRTAMESALIGAAVLIFGHAPLVWIGWMLRQVEEPDSN